MNTSLKYILFVVLLISFSVGVWAQTGDDFDMEQQEEHAPAKEKEITPEIRMWYLKGNGAFIDSTKLDTLQDYFHLYHPVYKNAITATYIGNYGSAYLNNDFFGRKSSVNYFLLRNREAYLLTPGRVEYYNTRTPYTRLDYSQSENRNSKNETRFNVIHSQNVNPYLNFTFRYDLGKSQGQYLYQEGKNNFVTLYSSYNRDKLKIHSGFIVNSINNQENGGLSDDSQLLSGEKSEYLFVNLVKSKTSFNSNYFYGTSEYRFGKYIEPKDTSETRKFRPIVGIMYAMNYERTKHQFIDEEDTKNTFFDNTYFGDEFINDSIRYNKLSNVFQIKQYENTDRKTSFGKRAFLGQEFVNTSMHGIDTVLNSRKTTKFSNVYVGGGIFRETGNFWKWNFDGKFYLLGRNIGQTELNGIITKPMNILGDSLVSLNLQGSILNLVPDFFQEELNTNHFQWSQNLKMEQRMVVKGSFISQKYKLEVGSNYAIINNFIYNDTIGIPAQTGKEILIVSAFLNKNFDLRNFHFRTKLLWQKSSNTEYLHLPEFSGLVSGYYKFIVSKVLYSQVGVDVRYFSSFYADAYSPATGLFYLQNEKKVGDFPYIDAYASIRLKRTRLFFKMINVGTNFIKKEYFTTPHYPMNRSTFRLGVSWAFYD